MKHLLFTLKLIFTFFICDILLSSPATAEIVENKAYAGEKIKISYGLWGGADEAKIAKQICELFVEDNPDIQIDISIYPWGQYWAKLQTQAVSGLAPDVISMYSGNMGVWIENGAFLPLDGYIEEDSIDINDYYRGTVESCIWEGVLYCMPMDISARILAYSVDRFEENGIPMVEWPRSDKAISWDEFKRLSKKLTLRDAQGDFYQYGMGIGEMWNPTMFRMYGGNFADRQVNPIEPTVAGNEKLVKGIIEVFKAQYGDRTTLGSLGLSLSSAGNLDTLIISPKFAMCTTGPWALVQLKNAGTNFRLSPMPRNVSPSQLIHTNSLGIYKESDCPDEAWRFIKFITGEKAQSVIGSKLKGVPVLKSAKAAFINNEYGIKGCEAFIYDMPIAQTEIISANSYIIAEFVKWGGFVEQVISDEYDSQINELRQRYGQISKGEYEKFVSHMEAFIEDTIRTEVVNLQSGLDKAFERGRLPVPNFMVKVILPLIMCIVLVSLGVVYIFALRRNVKKETGSSFGLNNVAGYVCISPWLIGFCVFALLPIVCSILLSFTQWNMLKAPEWVGIRNYIHLLGDDYFWLGLGRTFKYALLVIPISLFGGLFTAGLLTCNVKGANIFKAIFYFPSLFTGAAAAVLWLNMFQKEHGVVNHILSFFNIESINWLDANHAFYTVILMNFFWIGGAMIIYYAAMKQIPKSLYEAAEIDGAGPIRKFVSVTIPMLSPVITFMVVVSTIGAFQVFTPALFFARDASMIGSPGDSLRFYAVNIYNEAFRDMRMGNACAYALILCFIIFVITMIQLVLSKRFVHTEGTA